MKSNKWVLGVEKKGEGGGGGEGRGGGGSQGIVLHRKENF